MIANHSRALRVQVARSSSADALAGLQDARALTLALVAALSEEQLERVHSPIMSPLVWDLAHIAAYEDLWLVHRHTGEELLEPGLAELYDAFETPRAVRGEVELLGSIEAYDYLEAVRERTAHAIDSHGIGDGFIHEMVLRHELQHTETMRQTMRIAALLGAGEPALERLEHEQRWMQIPAGPFQMGAEPEGFAYDNELPAHPVQLDAFAIESLPVTNERWMDFFEGGGYERREWWSQAGWEWRSTQQAHPEAAIAAGHPAAAACHLSWFEADAFARAHGARLPTEEEWERARPALAGVGQVWEWTSSPFGGYPGFVAHPYREYSEVFFGDRYRVLRGGSWATNPRVASATFRNWDLPERRQIFAGVRLARDER